MIQAPTHKSLSTTTASMASLFASVFFTACNTAVADKPVLSGGDLASLPRTVSPMLSKVKPPANPQVFNERISDEELAKRPSPKQPPELTRVLLNLEKGSIEERTAKLKAKAIADLVYVQGGKFMRGDFGKLAGFDALTFNEDDKVVREIILSDFWIAKYKATYAEFDVFTDATGRQRTGMEFNGESRHPLIPAGAYWQEAKEYCLWLGKITGYPFDLPTEAQWEYAGRSRGQFFATATDNGHLDKGRNAPSSGQARILTAQYVKDDGWRYPVALFPPNSLGLYDMAYHSFEWTNDWYAKDAYAKADARDPRGPETGKSKVIRSWYISNGQILGTNVWRNSNKPLPDDLVALGKNFPYPTAASPTLRCVVNSVPPTRP